MENTARIIDLPKADIGYQQRPTVHERVKGDGRAIAVAKFRELADKLERGEIDGARAQWLDTHGSLVEDAEGKRYDLTKTDAPSGSQSISGIEFLTRTAHREDGSGEVQLRCVTIEEV